LSDVSTLIPKAARRYAEALYDLAKAQGCLDRVLLDIGMIGTALPASPELVRFLPEYAVRRSQRLSTLEALFKEGCHPLTWKFLLFLESKRRMALLPGVCKNMSSLHDKSMGIVDVALATALPVEDSDLDMISGVIKSKLSGVTRLCTRIDSDLIGGFVFQAGDVVHDYSVRGALKNLRKKLENAKT
jgi:F-type H+-transporting ATPase subunit delta